MPSPWPHVVIDALDPYPTRRPSKFTPLLTSRRPTTNKRPHDLVENEPGLIDAIEATAAILQSQKQLCTASRVHSANTSEEDSNVSVVNLSEIVSEQQGFDFPLRAVNAPATLTAPLLFSSLIHNRSGEDVLLGALGAQFILPHHSAFFLGRARRWPELAPLVTSSGYRLILLDPPWHSRSVQRAHAYTTCDEAALLSELVPAINAIRDTETCLLCCWVTNSKKVQDFVEEQLFPACDATPIARWYWLKLAADGSYAGGSGPSSPHRKPWEVLLIGHAGRAPPPPVPPRLVFACVPYAQHHSAKPPIDALLKEHSHAHMGEDAWERLPKMELFARELRPHWHACGDEVLRFQHEAFHDRARLGKVSG